MKALKIAGMCWLFVIAIWMVRLCLGMEHVSRDQIPPMIIGGVCGGLGAWYASRRKARKLAA